jgi:hypothetical protein
LTKTPGGALTSERAYDLGAEAGNFHRNRLGQSPSSLALRDNGDAPPDVVQFRHLFSVSLLPLSTAWMAVSELAPEPRSWR